MPRVAARFSAALPVAARFWSSPKLNTAAREGKYADPLWKDWTGKELQELDAEWRNANEERINATHPKVGQTKTNASAK